MFGALCDGPYECNFKRIYVYIYLFHLYTYICVYMYVWYHQGIKRVREQIRAQSDVIKIMTSGGVLSAFDQPTDQELSAEEVRAIVQVNLKLSSISLTLFLNPYYFILFFYFQEAARADRSCAAHAHGERGIAVAVYNGVKTLEHGSYLNTTLAQAVKDHDMIYVSLLYIYSFTFIHMLNIIIVTL